MVVQKKRLPQTTWIERVHSLSTHCPVKIAFTVEGKTRPIWCGLWTCQRCAVINARLWAWRVRIHVHEHGQKAYFWTLTLGPGYRRASDGFVALPRLWDRFRKNATLPGRKLSYCAFVEGQPYRSYMPHFHVVSLTPSPVRIKDLAVFCGFGHQAVEEPITDDQGAHYVAKYASKQSPFTPRNFRRVRTSKDWAKLPKGHWPALLVRSRNETILNYLLEVERVSGQSIDLLYDRWVIAHEDYGMIDYEPLDPSSSPST